jgi:hypothetical protein
MNERLDELTGDFVYIEETRNLFHEEISCKDIDCHAYIRGYWQSWKYFQPIEQLLRSELIFQIETFPSQVKFFGKMLKETSSVSIHIRRTDYAQNPHLGILPVDYYYKAVEYFKNKNSKINFYVFSDDSSWVESVFEIPSSFEVVRGPSCIEDLYLMSCCQYNIIANSSYSWWAAWLNNNPDKLVIAPQIWKIGERLDVTETDLIPPKWICL